MQGQDFKRLNNQQSKNTPQPTPSRRQFMGLLGTGAAASMRMSGAASAQEMPVISMGNNFFDPIGIRVEPGTTVRFEIEAGTHSATAYDNRIPSEATSFDSGVISEGGFEHTFDTPGTYDYYCIPHQSMGMVGRIVVGKPGGPAEDGPIPDGTVPDSETIVNQGTVTNEAFKESHGDAGGGMMGAGSGMMNGDGPGWMVLMPLGFVTTLLGLVGGVAYWAARRGATEQTNDDSAMAILREQYAQGEINQDEYTERKRQLQQEEQRDD